MDENRRRQTSNKDTANPHIVGSLSLYSILVVTYLHLFEASWTMLVNHEVPQVHAIRVERSSGICCRLATRADTVSTIVDTQVVGIWVIITIQPNSIAALACHVFTISFRTHGLAIRNALWHTLKVTTLHILRCTI